MFNTNLTWRSICSAFGLVGVLIWVSDTGLAASPRYDWCYNECGTEESCDTLCENDGGGTITCGDYHDGYPEWCDADNCDEVCNQDSNPGVECIWLGEDITCYDFGIYGYCGDGRCQNITLGENGTNCEEDCDDWCPPPPPPPCGNSICEPGQTYMTCPQDCDDPLSAGSCDDGICSSGDGEDEENCFQDCATPNERCDDDYDCPSGSSCTMHSGPNSGQCIFYYYVSLFGTCEDDLDCATTVGPGFVCRQVEEPGGGGVLPMCIFFYAVEWGR